MLRQTSDRYIIAKLVLGNFIGLRRPFPPEYLFYFVVFATAVEHQVILFRPVELTREYVFATAMLSAAAAYFGYETVATMWKRRI